MNAGFRRVATLFGLIAAYAAGRGLKTQAAWAQPCREEPSKNETIVSSVSGSLRSGRAASEPSVRRLNDALWHLLARSFEIRTVPWG